MCRACRYDDFYFLTEPGMLIYSHCPEETGWQLLHPARSRTEYEEYPLVKSFFFSIGMQFLQQNRGIVFTKRGIVTITLGFTQPTAFTFKLTYGETGSDHLQVADCCIIFLRTTAATAVAHLSHCNSVHPSVCLSICLFVCLSHGWISPKQCKIRSPIFYRRLPGRF